MGGPLIMEMYLYSSTRSGVSVKCFKMTMGSKADGVMMVMPSVTALSVTKNLRHHGEALSLFLKDLGAGGRSGAGLYASDKRGSQDENHSGYPSCYYKLLFSNALSEIILSRHKFLSTLDKFCYNKNIVS